ncbi:MAG: glycosyltransferase family 2 protein [Nitrosarchaeum sp.]|nr:glycosyltransferase family 2 protein [Nitrosarchaeum sp.]
MNYICNKHLSTTQKPPKISIGVPIHNGAHFIEARLNSILNQTYTDFEVIISDNASTDTTEKICKKFQNNDKRIKIFRQKTNLGLFWNFKFVLDQANGDYFVIANVDDLWEKDFLQENLQVLESNPKVVVSMGKIIRYGSVDKFMKNLSDKKIKRLYKKFRQKFRPFNIYSVTGDFKTKAEFCLRNYNFWIQFGLFRRSELQKSMLDNPFYGWDYALVINTLRYGDVHIVDKILMQFYSKGASGKGIIEFLKQQKLSKFDLFLPNAQLTKWCIKNIGIKFFIKNIDYFIRLNLLTMISTVISVIIEKSVIKK